MKKYLIIIALAVFAVACGNKGKSNETTSSVDGQKIYKANCTLCHGDDGKLGLNNSKDLTASKLTMDERITMIKNGKGAMTGFSSLLTEEEIKAVAEYTFKL